MAIPRKEWEKRERMMDTLPTKDELYALIDALTYNQHERIKAILLRMIETGDDDTEHPAKERAIEEFAELVKWINDKDLPLLLNVVRSFTKNLR